MKRQIAISLVFVALVGCSPAKRIDRLLDRFPGRIRADTTWVMDTVVSRSVRFDTVFTLGELRRDTIVVREGLAVQKIYLRDSVIYTDVECLPDTIIREIVRTVNLRPTERKRDRWGWIPGAIVLALIAGFLMWVYGGIRR